MKLRNLFFSTALTLLPLLSLNAFAQSVVLTPSDDATLLAQTPTLNQGFSSTLTADSNTTIERSLVKYDLNQLSAAGVTAADIDSVQLSLSITLNDGNWGNGNGPSAQIEIAPLNEDWAEGEATWNSATTGGVNWAGGNFAGVTDSVVASTASAGSSLQLDVTNDVMAILNGAANFGWVIKKAQETGTGMISFSSKEGSVAPQLIITLNQDIDLEAPVIEIVEPSEVYYLGSLPSEISVNYLDDLSGVDITTLMIKLSGVDITSSCSINAGSATCPVSSLTEGTHPVDVSISDLSIVPKESSVRKVFMYYADVSGGGDPTQDLDNVLSIGNSANGQQITNLGEPWTPQDAATKNYVDDAIATSDDADKDKDSKNELQTLSRSGSDVTLSNDGKTVSINDADADNTNELQKISKTGDMVTLSNDGGEVFVGDITEVKAGTGLTGGGDFKSVTLNADTSYLQKRVSSSCAEGSSIRVIAVDGSVTCEPEGWTSTTLPDGTEQVTTEANVGVGTTLPARILHVSGAMRLEPINDAPLSPSSGDLYYSSSEALCVYTSTGWTKIAGSGYCGPVSGTAPVANAGVDQNVNVNNLVALDGSLSSDPNRDPLTYSWTITNMPAGSSAVLSNSSVVNPTFTPDTAGTYIISLVVNDGHESSGADTVTITVTTETVGTVISAGGQVWMDRNLGASQLPTRWNPLELAAAGDSYQWGRGADGHQLRSSSITTVISSTVDPGHGNFIVADSSTNYSWIWPVQTYMWQGVDGINNPCPAGFRLPTPAEWELEVANWVSKDYYGAWASPLKLLAAGARNSSLGSVGRYWTSSPGVYLSFYLNGAGVVRDLALSAGASVRCIKD